MLKMKVVLTFVLAFSVALAADVEYLVLTEDGQDVQDKLFQTIQNEIPKVQSKLTGTTFDVFRVKFNRDDEPGSLKNVCDRLRSQQTSLIMDLTWGGWSQAESIANSSGFPYLRIDSTNHHFVKVN